MQQAQLGWVEPSNGTVQAAKREDLRGEVLFASEEQQAQRSAELLGAGALVVTVPPPHHETRGRLGEVLEELVERELARMGAPSPYLAAWSAMPEDAQARLADQLFRVRTVGATGLAIALGSLSAIAAPTLTTDDSATLRWLAETTEEAPLVLLVDDADLMTLGYAAPLPLGVLLATRRPMWETSPSSSLDVIEESAMVEEERGPIVLVGEDATTNDTRVMVTDGGGGTAAVATTTAAVATTTAAVATAAVLAHAHEHELEHELELEHAGKKAAAGVSPIDPIDLPQVVVETVLAAAAATPEVGVHAVKAPARERLAGRRGSSVGIPVSGPGDAWRRWAIALAGARGAQPLAAFERLFAESYVPLANAIAAGLEDPRALRAYDEFRRSFERSYTDAFTAFGATNRRPRLVMDAYDIAAKQARLSNARSSHVLVVDSMRFDLGCLVRDALGREAAGTATLTSEVLLWSALPTTTMRQIETFARGLDALRAPAREDAEEPTDSLRGRAAEVVRRLRVGSRELYKLDIVPALLDNATDVVGSFENIAAATAEAIARHVSTLPARTLLFILGDHGFGLDRHGAIRTGGASPEEVLVPAFSWLVGDLH